MMQLKPEIRSLLTSLGATAGEITALTSYYADQLTQAQGEVTQLNSNLASIQVQIGEAEARAAAIQAAIEKFVVESTVE